MPFDNVNYEPSDDVLRILRAARAVIFDPKNHALGSRNVGHSDGHVSHCALGAVDAAMLSGTPDYVIPRYARLNIDVIDALAKGAMPVGIDPHNPGFTPEMRAQNPSAMIAAHNNVLGHAATIEMFDRAIALRLSYLMEAAHAV